jgi:hypothetical protein
MAGCQDLLKNPTIASFGAGTLIHQVIGMHFRNSVSGAINAIIPGASAGPLRTQGLCGDDASFIKPQGIGGKAGAGFPDLARITPGRILQVAEIKPASLSCLIDGENQVLRYIDQGNATDSAQAAWRAALGISTVSPMLASAYRPPRFDIWAPRLGRIEIRTAWCSSGILAYTVKRYGEPEPLTAPKTKPAEERERQPVRVEQTSYQLIKEFVKNVIDSGVNADAAAGRFLQLHPEIGGAIIAAGVAVVIALLADDATIVGIIDDVSIPPILMALYRAAQMMQPAR